MLGIDCPYPWDQRRCSLSQQFFTYYGEVNLLKGIILATVPLISFYILMSSYILSDTLLSVSYPANHSLPKAEIECLGRGWRSKRLCIYGKGWYVCQEGKKSSQNNIWVLAKPFSIN